MNAGVGSLQSEGRRGSSQLRADVSGAEAEKRLSNAIRSSGRSVFVGMRYQVGQVRDVTKESASDSGRIEVLEGLVERVRKGKVCGEEQSNCRVCERQQFV